MKKLKQLIVTLALLAPLTFAAAPVANAASALQFCNDSNAKNTDLCKENTTQGAHPANPVIKALRITVSIMSFVIGFTAVIMLIIGGINMATSGGDPQKASRARGTITYALVGIVVAAVAETLVAFVLSRV